MKTRPIVLSPRERLKELRGVIWLCFELIGETDMKEVANRSGLCLSTLYRLRRNSPPVTLAVRYGTVQALGLAAGLRIQFVKGRAVLSLSEAQRAEGRKYVVHDSLS